MSDNIVKYNSRTFNEIKVDLINSIRETYPEIYNDFTDSSIGTMLIDLNAGVTNNIAMNTDRVFQETQLEYAQKYSSIVDHAKRLGFNIPSRKPSVTLVDFSVEIPVLGDGPNSSYYPLLMPGAIVSGGGKNFETQDIIDWSSPIDALGQPNRSIIPNVDSNGITQSYTVTKRELVLNGSSKIFKRTISPSEVLPFYSILLPDDNVVGIESVILLEGTNYDTNPDNSEFYNPDVRYHEVEYLAQQRIFTETQKVDVVEDSDGLKSGKWVSISKKFLKEFTPNGYCRLIFGSGESENNLLRDGLLKEGGLTNEMFVENILQNTALGEKLKPNHTLFVKYRVGGGTSSNIGKGVVNQMGTHNLMVVGPRQDINVNVRRSLSVTNPIPAFGGNDGLTVDQIRNLIKYNQSSQNRDVTLNDYVLQVFKMPGRFGSPYRASAQKKDNKVVISMLGLDNNRHLSNTMSNVLTDNITEYLSGYRMINDYVQIRNGKIFNLGFDIEVIVEDISNLQIVNNINNVVVDFFDVSKNQMNQDVFLGRLEEKILNVNGVINVIRIIPYNKFGGQYSNNIIGMEINQSNGQITTVDNTIFASGDSMFEIKFPEKDIRVITKKRVGALT